MDRLKSKFEGALLGTVMGDALGAPVEGWECPRLRRTLAWLSTLEPAVRAQTLEGDVIGLLAGADPGEGSARYTDDGQMTLALSEAILDAGRVDGPTAARWFAERFEAHRGYGGSAAIVLSRIQKGEVWDEPARRVFGGQGSFGNGAAMRAAPVGLWHHADSADTLRDAAIQQALPTHTHPLGIEGAVWQSAAVAAAVRADPEVPLKVDAFLAEVRPLLESDAYVAALDAIPELLTADPPPCAVAAALGNDIAALRSVPAALYAFVKHSDSFEDAVRWAVTLGGDTDTIGAMCGALSGAWLGVEAIPARWLDALENGRQGRDYARELAGRLYQQTLSPPRSA